MPSPEASRRNLKRAQNPWTERSQDESLLNWKLTFDWWMKGERREPRTQSEWARVLGVRQSYVSKMVSRFESDLRKGILGWYARMEPVTLADLQREREVRVLVRARLAEEQAWKQYERQQRADRKYYGEEDESEDDAYEQYAESSDEEQQPASSNEPDWVTVEHPDPQLRGLVWVRRRWR